MLVCQSGRACNPFGPCGVKLVPLFQILPAGGGLGHHIVSSQYLPPRPKGGLVLTLLPEVEGGSLPNSHIPASESKGTHHGYSHTFCLSRITQFFSRSAETLRGLCVGRGLTPLHNCLFANLGTVPSQHCLFHGHKTKDPRGI